MGAPTPHLLSDRLIDDSPQLIHKLHELPTRPVGDELLPQRPAIRVLGGILRHELALRPRPGLKIRLLGGVEQDGRLEPRECSVMRLHGPKEILEETEALELGVVVDAAIVPRGKVDVDAVPRGGVNEEPLLAADIHEGVDDPVEEPYRGRTGARARSGLRQLQEGEDAARGLDVAQDVKAVVGEPGAQGFLAELAGGRGL